MKRVEVKELLNNYNNLVGKSITLAGWVKSTRDNKSIGFIDLMDGTCFKSVQVVLFSDKISNYDKVSKLNTGSSIMAEGEIVLTPEAKQPFDFVASSVTVINETTEEYPLQKKRHSVEFLREIAYLRPRTNLFQAVFRVRSVAAYAIHKYFQERNYVYFHAPLITASDCEGAGEMFQVTTLDLESASMTMVRSSELRGLRRSGEVCCMIYGISAPSMR